MQVKSARYSCLSDMPLPEDDFFDSIEELIRFMERTNRLPPTPTSAACGC